MTSRLRPRSATVCESPGFALGLVRVPTRHRKPVYRQIVSRQLRHVTSVRIPIGYCRVVGAVGEWSLLRPCNNRGMRAS
jgi:hypothetical protein